VGQPLGVLGPGITTVPIAWFPLRSWPQRALVGSSRGPGCCFSPPSHASSSLSGRRVASLDDRVGEASAASGIPKISDESDFRNELVAGLSSYGLSREIDQVTHFMGSRTPEIHDDVGVLVEDTGTTLYVSL